MNTTKMNSASLRLVPSPQPMGAGTGFCGEGELSALSIVGFDLRSLANEIERGENELRDLLTEADRADTAAFHEIEHVLDVLDSTHPDAREEREKDVQTVGRAVRELASDRALLSAALAAIEYELAQNPDQVTEAALRRVLQAAS